MRSAVLLTVALMISGCATVWYRDGTTEQQFYADEYECQAASMGMGGVSGYGTVYRGVAVGGLSRTQDRRMYDLCMRARGYTDRKG